LKKKKKAPGLVHDVVWNHYGGPVLVNVPDACLELSNNYVCDGCKSADDTVLVLRIGGKSYPLACKECFLGYYDIIEENLVEDEDKDEEKTE